jgi:CheY-like chemotaxis protein
MKILIVDDDSTNSELIKEMVKYYLEDIELLDKSTIDITNDGTEAVKSFRQNEQDVIFMDVMMPQMDGFEATRQIRLLDTLKQPVIIMVTALDDIESVRKGFLNGASWYITKPYDMEVLEVLLNDIVAGKLYLQIEKESIVEKKISAKEFMSDFILEFTIDKLETLNDDMLKALNNFMTTDDKSYLLELSNGFLRYSEYIKETKEFDKIAFGLLEISEILKEIKDDFDREFFIDFMFGVLSDLKSWSENIFINQISIDIHYLDDSLISSIMQLRSLLKTDEELIEEEIDFF